MIGAGDAAGERRAHRAAEVAIANPLFDDASLKGARGVLISITGGENLTMYEVDEAASRIRQEVDEEANIIVNERPCPTRVHTEGQRQAQAAGHLNLEGSILHDGTEAGAGAVRRKPAL
jgi:hypothetical protein